ncbi:MAG: hypothetical protein IJ125_07705 [Atopobiaceae bacterium]|nr:hypothetical protein [Atopobiaceae bacterium]
MRRLWQEQAGQMSVELVVCMPVVLICAFVVFNLAQFVVVCSRFDRIVPDAILAHGASPEGEQTLLTSIEQVEQSIRDAMDTTRATIELTAEPLSFSEVGLLSLVGQPTRFTCVLTMSPWPSQLSVAGISLSAPQFMRHECSIVIDRYRPAVVV